MVLVLEIKISIEIDGRRSNVYSFPYTKVSSPCTTAITEVKNELPSLNIEYLTISKRSLFSFFFNRTRFCAVMN